MQAMLHSAFSVGASTIFASIVAEGIASTPAFAVLLVVIGASIPSATTLYLALRKERSVDKAEADAKALIDKAALEAKRIIEEAIKEQTRGKA